MSKEARHAERYDCPVRTGRAVVDGVQRIFICGNPTPCPEHGGRATDDNVEGRPRLTIGPLPKLTRRDLGGYAAADGGQHE